MAWQYLAAAVFGFVTAGLSVAETHTIIPDRYYDTFSYAHPPVGRIRPGDRVVTKLLDRNNSFLPSFTFDGRCRYGPAIQSLVCRLNSKTRLCGGTGQYTSRLTGNGSSCLERYEQPRRPQWPST